MTNIQSYTVISTLSEEQKQEAANFIKSLKQTGKEKRNIKERQFGYARGGFTMSENFEDPLDDFKEYM